MSKNNEYQIPNEIYQMAAELIKLWDSYYDYIKIEVEDIINNNIVDPKRIEYCLDNISNIPTEKCYKLMKKLCNYYAKIDKESAKFYLNDYIEFYGFEEKKKIKKRLPE